MVNDHITSCFCYDEIVNLKLVICYNGAIKSGVFSIEKIIIVGVDLGAENFRESMNELRQLVLAAGGEVVGELTQKREAIKSSTYLGKGKNRRTIPYG